MGLLPVWTVALIVMETHLLASGQAPGPVTDVRWLPQSESTVDVQWEDPEVPNGEITQFIIKLLNYTSGMLLESVTVDANDTYEVSFGVSTTLVAGVPYSHSVIAVNSNGEGEQMLFTNFTAAQPAKAPSDVTAQYGRTEMNVSWTPLTLVQARGFVQYYIITIRTLENTTKRHVMDECVASSGTCLASAANTGVRVTELDPGAVYGVTVAAVSGLQAAPSEPPEEVGETDIIGETSEERTVPETVVIAPDGQTDIDITAIVVGGVLLMVLVIAITAVVIVVIIIKWKRSSSSFHFQAHVQMRESDTGVGVITASEPRVVYRARRSPSSGRLVAEDTIRSEDRLSFIPTHAPGRTNGAEPLISDDVYHSEDDDAFQA